MKKIGTLLILLSSVFLLSSCDFFEDDGSNDVWYDSQTETLYLNWDLDEPEADPDTGETVDEFLFLQIRNLNSDEWIEIMEVDNYSTNDMQISFRFEDFGEFEYRVVAKDVDGNVLRFGETRIFYVEKPQYVHYFDSYFDHMTGEVRFQFGINPDVVAKVLFEKSNDGGLNWEEVAHTDIIMNEDYYYDDSYSYYEFDEGSYVYQITGFDSSDNELQVLTSWGETYINFTVNDLSGDPTIHNVDTQVDIYSGTVNIWWYSTGDYETSLIEKSIDGVSWVIIGEVPRFSQGFNYLEEIDGDYFYRVSAVDELGTTVHTYETLTAARVKSGAVIGWINGWYDYGQNVRININWDTIGEDIDVLILERKEIEDAEFVVVGEFGNLKKMYEDEDVSPGTYIYRLTAKDVDGIVLDSLESNEIFIEQESYVYHFDAYFYDWDGLVSFNYGLNFNQVDYIVIEKSSDGGLTYTEVLNKDIEGSDYSYEGYAEYYEPIENTYIYRITAYNVDDDEVGMMNSWWEVNVNYQFLNLDGDVMINDLASSFDIYNQNVNLWWQTQGDYTTNLIEKSLDCITWVEVVKLPRVVQAYNFIENDDGEYYYRISALDESDVVLDSFVGVDILDVRTGAVISYINAWVNYNEDSVDINWDIIVEEVALISLHRKEIDGDWVLLGEFGNLKRMVEDIGLAPGTYIYRVSALDEIGDTIDSIESNEIYIEEPIYVYHLNAYFTDWNGIVSFNYGINYGLVNYVVFEKSTDGGLTFTEVLTHYVDNSGDYYYDGYAEYSEMVEGTYAYRMIGYDFEDNQVGTVYSWSEVNIDYSYLNLDQPVEIYHVGGYVNIYYQEINLWWGSDGTFDAHLIEKSVDGFIWETVTELPRYAQSYSYTELVDGNYYYRVSAIDESDVVLSVLETGFTLRVEQDAVIGSIYCWFDYNSYKVSLNWDLMNEDVSIIRLERKLVDDVDFTLVSDFGNLKQMYVDEVLVEGIYIYKITVFDSDMIELDSLISSEVEVNLPD